MRLAVYGYNFVYVKYKKNRKHDLFIWICNIIADIGIWGLLDNINHIIIPKMKYFCLDKTISSGNAFVECNNWFLIFIIYEVSKWMLVSKWYF